MKKDPKRESDTIYQSGQRVATSGVYRVAGTETKTIIETKEKFVRQLEVGELFPNYEGRAVAWHFEAEAAEH